VTPISVIIPVRNEGEAIVRTIESIVRGRCSPFPLEIIVVDDASTDGACDSLGAATETASEVSLIVRRLDRWCGIPYARNRGAEAASYPIYVMTDGNTLFPLGWDLPLRHNFGRSRLLAGTIVDMTSPVRGFGCALVLPSMGVSWIPTPGLYGGYVPVTACACTVIDRSLFHHLGGYDESLPLYGAAEPEFSVRAWLSGYEIVNLPDLLIRHRFRPEAEQDAFCASINPLLIRNFLRFSCYYLPEDLLTRTYDYYAALSPDDFESCMSELVRGGVWTRREQLHKELPLDFRWFARKFGLTELATKR